jgi:nucleotide-binding universal stress UspA family protein
MTAMNKIRTILFPTDFSDTAQNAFKHCLLIAGKLDAKIILLHVIYPEFDTMDLPVIAAKAMKDKTEAARITLQSFRDYGIAEIQKQHEVDKLPDIQIDVEVGSPANVIKTVANRDEAGLVVMGTKGQHNAVERALGSVAAGVSERVHCPVIVIPEAAAYQEIKIVAYATDLKEADPYHLWKAGQLLEVFNPILHVVHVDTGKSGKEEVDFTEMKDFFSERTPALQVQFHDISEISVEEGLEEFVETYDVDMLVMYAPHHNLLERIFQRSNTRRMALETHIPLLLLKTG